MATWAMRQRYAWIDAKLAAGETFTREDIVQAFTVTKQTASATVAEYRELQPDALRYDASAKVFCRSDWTAPKLEGWRGRAERAEVVLTEFANGYGVNHTSRWVQGRSKEVLAAARTHSSPLLTAEEGPGCKPPTSS